MRPNSPADSARRSPQRSSLKDAPMRFSQHSRMSVTRRGEKELRLGAFIARSLHALTAPAESRVALPQECTLLVMARSAQSPVVKSLAALAREVAAAGCSVRMILARA